MKDRRIKAGIMPDRLEEDLILGPGWIERFESGDTVPDIGTLFILIDRIGIDPAELFQDLRRHTEDLSGAAITRLITAEQDGSDLIIHFQYANHDAQYRLATATVSEFDVVLKSLRDGLARLVRIPDGSALEKAIKTNAVAAAFLAAVQTWPRANPSDLWWFVVYRAYCDPYNHPAIYARLSFEQSWKRTGGWALEEIVVRHYASELAKHEISMEIAYGERKEQLLAQLTVHNRLESDKVDVILVGPGDVCFGVVHVKASFAERRTDDVPMSEALVDAGYCSPLWTMDCKSTPSERPLNRGELGSVTLNRSAKRRDIEDDGLFSACFSYNRNTNPTPAGMNVKAYIHVCDFGDPRDAFSEFLVAEWTRFSQMRKSGS